MSMSLIWKAMVIFFCGTLVLRLGGRKSISQMTIAQTVVMIGMGELIIQPLADKSLTLTFIAAFTLVIFMLILEYLELKFNFIENIFSGKAVIVIDDGKLNTENMKKLRLTVDRLETRLRQIGVSSIDEVKYATIEVSGQIGYELKDDMKPLTKGEFFDILSEIPELKSKIQQYRINKNGDLDKSILGEIKNPDLKNNPNKLK
ncbi:DUF421 domain-containing protein [Clostridium manihotivorum]|uniref:DUF421 domain-containing protein n=2 Tax=Clostridium manihotivorum TaxID=2320868 RepID=A0A3R5QYI0_9CLOT|nr:DUF421 domain-containing protein [Clostridium manihotivorum]